MQNLAHLTEQVRADVYLDAPITLVGRSPKREIIVTEKLAELQQMLERIGKFARRHTRKCLTELIVEEYEETPTYIYYEIFYHDRFLPVYLGINPDGEVFCTIFLQQYHSRKQLKFLRRFKALLDKVYAEFPVRELRVEDTDERFPEELPFILNETISILT